MKLAYFSPLNPQKSGISDYSEEILPHLAKEAEITLFVDGFRPTNEEILEQFPYVDYKRNPSHLASLREFDAFLYHMGNDHRYHAGMLDVMQTYPGIVVFHDFALQDFFLGLARLKGRSGIYLDEVAACHGEEIRRSAEESLKRNALPAILSQPTTFPLNRRLATAAEGIIVHSEWSRVRFERIAPGVPLLRINMPVKPAPNSVKPSSRAFKDEVRIANFGLITPGKGIEQALRALSTLKSTHSFRYILVGEPNSFFPVQDLIERYRMIDRVTITGHLPLNEFECHMLETDIALNMRERTVGETSASLCRLMRSGVPSIVCNVGWYAELPNDCVVKIDIGANSDELLLAYLVRLIEDESLRLRIGENARRYAQEAHSIQSNVTAYLKFIQDVINRRPQRTLISSVATEIVQLGLSASDKACLFGVASEVAALSTATATHTKDLIHTEEIKTTLSNDSVTPSLHGRLPKIDGLDYKRAAIEYPGRLDAERQHYLFTKPFYNLANKPPKHKGDGMDAETFRHFCDFANMAVALALPAGARILDVGCGSGWLSEYLARLGYDVTGIDISEDLVRIADRRLSSIPYGVDHELPLRYQFLVHDIEDAPLAETFDAVICYDALHHFQDERSVMRHLAQVLPKGGLLFLTEGERPESDSPTEHELLDVMRQFGTLESPFDYEYLRALLDENGFAVVGDYVSVNGFFEREMFENNCLPLNTLPTTYHYLNCRKVSDFTSASKIPDSRNPGMLRARISLHEPAPSEVRPGENLSLTLNIENSGDTTWLTGQTTKKGVVMPAIRLFDKGGSLLNEIHGPTLLPRAVVPGETISIRIGIFVPFRPGEYVLKIDLVDQHVCWFEEQGSEPLLIPFKAVG